MLDVPSSSGAEGSQGTRFCREGRAQRLEVSEREAREQWRHFTFADAESELMPWTRGKMEKKKVSCERERSRWNK